jgi:hypothetical protein
VFLAATTAGAGAAIGSVVVFGAVTIATIVGLTLFAAPAALFAAPAATRCAASGSIGGATRSPRSC